MAMVKLGVVGNRALRDPEFWKELRADPRGTLRKHRMELAEADYRRLEDALNAKSFKADLNTLMDGVHERLRFHPERAARPSSGRRSPQRPPKLSWQGSWKGGRK